MKPQNRVWTFVLLVVLVPSALFVLVSWFESRISGLPVLGPANHRITSFHLRNQAGETITTDSWNNRIIVANYFFTHCAVVCPKMVKNLQQVQVSAGDAVLINSFTVDPVRDDVERLSNYAKKFSVGENWHLLTGDKKELYRFARKDLMIVATDGDGGEDDFIHSENLVLIDPDKRIRGFYKGTDANDTRQLIRDINKLKKEYQLD